MKTNEAAIFAIETVKNAKNAMLANGYIDEQLIFAVCKKLANVLNLDLYTIMLMFETV
jgi:hypothetical protein